MCAGIEALHIYISNCSLLIPSPYSLVHPRPIWPYSFLSSPFQYLLYCRAVWLVKIRTVRVAVWRAVRHTQGRFIMYCGNCKNLLLLNLNTSIYQTSTDRMNMLIFAPVISFFIVLHIYAAWRCKFIYWENSRMTRGAVLSVRISHSKSLVTVQRAFRAKYSTQHFHMTWLT